MAQAALLPPSSVAFVPYQLRPLPWALIGGDRGWKRIERGTKAGSAKQGEVGVDEEKTGKGNDRATNLTSKGLGVVR